MDNETPIIHTFNTDIKEELNRKDAGLIDIAAANTNHIQPANPVNYKALVISICLLIFVLILLFLAWTFYQNKQIEQVNIVENNIKQQISTSTPTFTLSSLMPESNSSLSPYIKYYKFDKKYTAYKIINYEGLLPVLLNNEIYIRNDLKKTFYSEGTFYDFVDLSYNNIDLRVASSTVGTSTLVYGMINRDYIIFAASIDDWQKAYGNIIK